MLLFIFQKITSKKIRTLPVIDQYAIILANLNIDDSDSRTDASHPNDSMKESQCVEEQDYSDSTNTKKQNYQNDSDSKIAEVTSNGRLKDFFVTENAVNLPNYEHSKAKVYPFSKGLKFFLHLILLIN